MVGNLSLPDVSNYKLSLNIQLPGQSIQERAAPTKSPTTSWQATDFPDPQKDPAACGVPYLSSSNVCNPNLIVNNYTGTVKSLQIVVHSTGQVGYRNKMFEPSYNFCNEYINE